MIAAQTIAGFANGGQIRGAGTNTSDSIPIMASHERVHDQGKVSQEDWLRQSKLHEQNW